jgi:hypothetical protein
MGFAQGELMGEEYSINCEGMLIYLVDTLIEKLEEYVPFLKRFESGLK